MIELELIGIGAGSPDHLTLQGVAALNAADLVLIPCKGAEKAALAEARRQICATHLQNPATRVAEFDLPRRDAAHPDYRAGVDDWHDAIALAWEAAISAHLPGGSGRVALLVWGDPSLYDSSLRIAERLAAQIALRVRVVPGITAVQALCAAHAIALNEIGAPVTLTTGRRLREGGWPQGATTLVVMLDGEASFAGIDPAGVTIWWGGNLGLPEQVLVAGPLAEVCARIQTERAQLRTTAGWVMDIYLLRRSLPG